MYPNMPIYNIPHTQHVLVLLTVLLRAHTYTVRWMILYIIFLKAPTGLKIHNLHPFLTNDPFLCKGPSRSFVQGRVSCSCCPWPISRSIGRRSPSPRPPGSPLLLAKPSPPVAGEVAALPWDVGVLDGFGVLSSQMFFVSISTQEVLQGSPSIYQDPKPTSSG